MYFIQQRVNVGKGLQKKVRNLNCSLGSIPKVLNKILPSVVYCSCGQNSSYLTKRAKTLKMTWYIVMCITTLDEVVSFLLLPNKSPQI